MREITRNQIIEKALKNKNKLKITYKDKIRIIQPACWYLVGRRDYLDAYCHYRNEWRTFRIARISKCILLNENCDIKPNSWNVMKHEFITGEQKIRFVQVFGQNKEKINDYPKSLTLEKHIGNLTCRSPLEERVYISYNDDNDVDSFKVEPHRIPYEFEGKKRLYIPDALVHYKNGENHLIEIKISSEIDLPLNKAKFLAAKQFCKKKGYIFRIDGISAQYSNYRSTGQYGWNSTNDQAPIVDLTPKNINLTKPDESIKPNNNNTNSNDINWDILFGIILITTMILFFILLLALL